MGNLLIEYRERHRMNFVLPTDEGLCFFDSGKTPTCICITSSLSRNFSTCRKCVTHKGGLVVELFVPSGGLNPCCNLAHHGHISPDVDLRAYANENIKGFGTLEPFAASGERDVEIWLWRFFAKHSGTQFKKQLCPLDQMIYCIQNHPKTFDTFYKQLFNGFVINRKYLLVR